MVRVAKLDCEIIEREAEIWEDDFLDSADPELIAQYKIEKREKAYQAKLAKEKEEAEKLADSTGQSEAKKSTNQMLILINSAVRKNWENLVWNI